MTVPAFLARAVLAARQEVGRVRTSARNRPLGALFLRPHRLSAFLSPSLLLLSD